MSRDIVDNEGLPVTAVAGSPSLHPGSGGAVASRRSRGCGCRPVSTYPAIGYMPITRFLLASNARCRAQRSSERQPSVGLIPAREILNPFPPVTVQFIAAMVDVQRKGPTPVVSP
jgi:hypothetical protein